MECDYTDVECNCDDTGWECEANTP
jgi:hypothetical protein